MIIPRVHVVHDIALASRLEEVGQLLDDSTVVGLVCEIRTVVQVLDERILDANKHGFEDLASVNSGFLDVESGLAAEDFFGEETKELSKDFNLALLILSKILNSHSLLHS